MVGIPSIGGIPEPLGPGSAQKSDARAPSRTAGSRKDDLTISEAAQNASAITQLVDNADPETQAVRQERIEQARQNVEQGIHRANDMVRLVAARLSGYFPD